MLTFWQLELESVLNVTVPSRGRFGTTVSSLADLNGDGLRDVAVGAPMEDDLRGAVYIYLGHQHTGIRPAFSQVSKATLLNDKYTEVTCCLCLFH